MFFKELNFGQCKSYLIADLDAGKAALIDPLAGNAERYLSVLAYHQLKLEFVVDTHTHADHRSGCVLLKNLTGAKHSMHHISPQPHVDVRFKDGDELMLGNIPIKILHTPGHTPDSISLYVNKDRVFTGDVILIRGTGRADFAGGDAGEQYDSITQKLFTLPDETLMFPGHDYRGNTQSTVAEEKSSNPRITGKTRDEYIEVMDTLNLPLPERIQEVLQINQSEVDDDKLKFPLLAELSEVMQLDAQQIKDKIESDKTPLIIDVREGAEFHGELGHIKGSRLIPMGKLPAAADSLDAERDNEIILVCRSGARSTTAAAILTGLGFSQVKNLSGGMLAWNEKGYAIER
ncbi:MAG: sulfurtransferase [Cycloclasticus sp. symbiont of Poecilosclerida sp. M]|nr:MAG: sulfurtransferase [Cycloclasticus sp. symbiont of Poecilosclerida sp. M]